MDVSATRATAEQIVLYRDLYRAEMNCQIIHDSLHARMGWTQSYLLIVDGAMAGYGAVAVGGPWLGKPTLFEFYVLPRYRSRVFDLFEALLSASGSTHMDVQSNDALITVMLHTFARDIAPQAILFHDEVTSSLAMPRALVRRVAPADAEMESRKLDRDAEWVLEFEGALVGSGGILYHYNRPYGDIYMSVAEPFRRRGLGSYLVQELKRICYEGGSVPAARCNCDNMASRRTLQKAGFVPCGQILTGTINQNSP